jgi:hypothetical protein
MFRSLATWWACMLQSFIALHEQILGFQHQYVSSASDSHVPSCCWKNLAIVSYCKYCMFRSQQHGEHVCYGHSLHFVHMLVDRFPILFISMIDYADHMPCMNCREEEINHGWVLFCQFWKLFLGCILSHGFCRIVFSICACRVWWRRGLKVVGKRV